MAQPEPQPEEGRLTFLGRRLSQLYEYDKVAIYGFISNAATGQLSGKHQPDEELATLRDQIFGLCVGVKPGDLQTSQTYLDNKERSEEARRQGRPENDQEKAQRAYYDAERSDWQAGIALGRREDGIHFTGAEPGYLAPTQHIRRARSEASFLDSWATAAEDSRPSRFATDAVEWPKSNVPRGQEPRPWQYFSAYDLLGLFLSRLGPAPPGANGRNFYLPLTTVFARWCLKIGGTKAKGKGPLPFMLQCTWIPLQRAASHPFFLGASMGGQVWTPAETGNWERELRFARYEVVEEIVSPVPELVDRKDNAEARFDFDRPARFVKFEPTRRKLAMVMEVVGESGVQSKAQMGDRERGALNREFADALRGLQELRDDETQAKLRAQLDECVTAIQGAAAEDNLTTVAKTLQTVWDKVVENTKNVRFGNCAETYPFVNLLL